MTKATTARLLLDGLAEQGIGYLFCNLGTDHVTLIEELADPPAGNAPWPRPILCPHETVAVHMAGGVAAMTGKGQAALVHVDAGTANAAMAMHNLMRMRLPVLLMAGRAPYASRKEVPAGRDSYVHFVQDPFDIRSIVRPYTKWEYDLPNGAVAKELVARATASMHSDPKAPVFLTLPREVLAETHDAARLPCFPPERFPPVAACGADPALVARVADALIGAENPVAFASYLGRSARAVAALSALAQEAGIRVVCFNAGWMNIAADHPCFAGFDPGPFVSTCDVGLMLDTDVPYVPANVQENPATRWFQMDVDPLKRDTPLWTFPAEARIAGDTAILLEQLLEAWRARAGAAARARAAARVASFAGPNAARAARIAAAAADPGRPDALNPAFALARLGAALAPEDVVLNEAVRSGPAVQDQIPRTLPLTYLGLAGGGLGFSGGMALGVRLARPGARVVNIVGDGTFTFTSPDAVYQVAAAEGLPIFTVVLDNRGWQAVKDATRRVHPDGAAARTDRFLSRLDAAKERRFEAVGGAVGAQAERVSDPEALDAAIARCLAAVEAGQSAVLTIRVAPL
jgi:acetolactate synthase-1/2/3 large subunit